MGHIINLSLQAFLLARSKQALAAALAATEAVADNEALERFSAHLTVLSTTEAGAARRPNSKIQQRDDLSGWGGIMPLRKLHNIGVWLSSSSLHADMWRDSVGLELGKDNITRWSSWFKVIDNATRKKTQINRFFINYNHDLGDDVLNNSDWELLERTHQFLQVFDEATRDVEGDYASITDTLFLMDCILAHYEDCKVGRIRILPTT